MTAPLPRPVDRDDAFEARWARWREGSAEQDRVVERRALVAAMLLGTGVGAWLAIALYLGQ